MYVYIHQGVCYCGMNTWNHCYTISFEEFHLTQYAQGPLTVKLMEFFVNDQRTKSLSILLSDFPVQLREEIACLLINSVSCNVETC